MEEWDRQLPALNEPRGEMSGILHKIFEKGGNESMGRVGEEGEPEAAERWKLERE